MPSRTCISNKKREIGITWGSVSGFQSFRDHGSVPYESLVERDFIIRASHDPEIAHIESQPFSIQYENVEGFMRTYTPDFKVTYRYRGARTKISEVYEVKPCKKLAQSINEDREKYQAAFNHCRYNGYIFKFIHEHKIRDQRWENAKILSRVRGVDYTDDDYQILVKELNENSTSSAKNLATRCFPQMEYNDALGIVCSLIENCLILYDATEPFTTTSKVWLPEDVK